MTQGHRDETRLNILFQTNKNCADFKHWTLLSTILSNTNQTNHQYWTIEKIFILFSLLEIFKIMKTFRWFISESALLLAHLFYLFRSGRLFLCYLFAYLSVYPHWSTLHPYNPNLIIRSQLIILSISIRSASIYNIRFSFQDTWYIAVLKSDKFLIWSIQQAGLVSSLMFL